MVGKKLPRDHLTAVHDRLKNFESMTWQEIFKSNQNHSVKIDRLATDAKTRLEEMGQSDIEDLVSLRIASRPRIWGILENATLKIIWWDPEHVICPALKSTRRTLAGSFYLTRSRYRNRFWSMPPAIKPIWSTVSRPLALCRPENSST